MEEKHTFLKCITESEGKLGHSRFHSLFPGHPFPPCKKTAPLAGHWFRVFYNILEEEPPFPQGVTGALAEPSSGYGITLLCWHLLDGIVSDSTSGLHGPVTIWKSIGSCQMIKHCGSSWNLKVDGRCRQEKPSQTGKYADSTQVELLPIPVWKNLIRSMRFTAVYCEEYPGIRPHRD